MHRLLSLISVASLLLALVALPAAAGSRVDVIVVFHDSVADARAAAVATAAQHGVELAFIYEHALEGFSGSVAEGRLHGLRNDPRVASVELDQLVEAYGEVPTGVDRAEADKKLGLGGVERYTADVDIAIIDTGTDKDHPDLTVVGGTDCSGGSPFKSSCDDSSWGVDDNGHGTHVGGTAAAKEDGVGVVGVAPGARLQSVKVLRSDGSGYMSWIVAGIDWVTARAGDIEVANMSLGCECSSTALDSALTRSTDAGVVYVVAAGNSGKDAKDYSPAKHPQVIAVSAAADFDGKAGAAAAPTCRDDVGNDDTFATFSNYGAVVDLMAPGVCIDSTVPGGGYAAYSGTSMASPHGAGAAALYILENSVPRDQARWSTVRDGLRGTGWSVANNDGTCGISGAKSSEPLLLLASCDTASGGGGGDTTAPAAPTDVTASAVNANDSGGSNDVTVSWTAVSASDLDRYDIYRCLGTSCTPTTSIGSVPAGTTTFTNLDLADGTYGYGVKAVDTSGNSSALSNVAHVEVTGSGTGGGSLVVASETYVQFGGKTNDHHLDITIVVTDGSVGVSGATVTFDLYRNDTEKVTTVSGTTGDDGSITFGFRGIGPGCYSADVTAVAKAGSTWDGSDPDKSSCTS